MFVQLLLTASPATYSSIVTLVKTFGGKTCLGKTSCAMTSLLISNSLRIDRKCYDWGREEQPCCSEY